MLVAEDEKGSVLLSKGTGHLVFIERTCLLCPSMVHTVTYENPKQNIISCKSGASLVGHDQSGLCMALKTHELQLTYIYYICLTKAITCWEVP